ncbi:MAG: pilus assembly protein PilM [Deltaproteobacteria bacterium]|nr:pilus assembly protein PilM [Deltaproteobacteria bacterium]
MRVIGLDIGSTSVKAIEVEFGLRQLELIDFFEEKYPLSQTSPSSEQIQKTIENLFLRGGLTLPFKMVASLSGLYVSSKQLTLPFTDKVKIKQTLPFELEEHIPFALEDIIFDYQIISMAEKNAQLLILIAPKDIIQERLALFPQKELSPDLLTSDAVALYNLTTSGFWQASEAVYALVNIGHQQTSVSIIEETKISQVRSISIGGQAITQAIQEAYHLSLEDAERAKIDNGFVLTDSSSASKDQIKFSDCIKKALDPLVSQLTQTFQSVRSKGKGVVQKIYITGGTSLLRNLPAYLSQELHMEVEFLKCLSSYETSNIADQDENNAKASGALSLALGLIGKSYGEQFNFRKEEFSKYQRGPLGKEVRYFLGMGSLVLAILFMNMIGNYFILRSTLKSINLQTVEVTKKFPIKIPENLLENATQLRSYLSKKAKEQKEKIEALGGGKGETLTALQVLQELSSLVPKPTLFDVREFSYVDGKIKIKAISDSFNSIDTIEKSLKNHSQFTKVTKGEISTASDGQNKDFTITFDIKKGKNS